MMRRIVCMLAVCLLNAGGFPAQQKYKIVNALSGKVLDVSGLSTANGARIWQWDWLNGLNQQWTIVPLGNGYNRIVN